LPNQNAWAQELMWVKRNKQGVVIGVRELPPETENFIPTLPSKGQACQASCCKAVRD